jgi:hypothetical protein
MERVVGHCVLFGAVNQATNKIMKKYIITLDGSQLTTRHNNQPITREHNGGGGIGFDYARPSEGAWEALSHCSGGN